MDKKTAGIVAYITLIGWLIALIDNSSKKDQYVSFHIRQMLGLIVTAVAIGFANIVLVFIPFLGWLVSMALSIGLLVFWILALVGAVNEEKKELPVVGAMFQNWFKSL